MFLFQLGIKSNIYKNIFNSNYLFEKRNDMSTIFLQQILSGKLLLVVIVGVKK